MVEFLLNCFTDLQKLGRNQSEIKTARSAKVKLTPAEGLAVI